MLQQKDQYELKRCGGYERIFPLLEKQVQSDPKLKKLQEQYDYLIMGSQAVWGEQMVGGGVCAKKRIDEILDNVKNYTIK